VSKFKFSLLFFLSFNCSSEALLPIQTRECETFNESLAAQRSPTKLLKSNAKDQLSELTFKFDVVGYGENGRTVSEIDETPHVAIPVKNGWLLGSDRGEWGGRLVYKTHDGNQKNIIDDNIKDIYEYSYGYIVVAGLGHMGVSRGTIYLVTVKNNNYVAEKIHSLAASPKSSWLTSTGELLINHGQMFSSVYTPTGMLYRVDCKNIKN
jgi:hypothetical protein